MHDDSLDYVSLNEVLDEALQDPETRAEWDRTQLARDVSIWLLGYRRDHGLTQTELAKRLGWKQPVVARLESGDHEPSLATLRHLVEQLGASARIDIHADGAVAVRFSRSPRRRSAGARGRTGARSATRQRATVSA
jgi:transcriptional regulator with XRE-family HTH domain